MHELLMLNSNCCIEFLGCWKISRNRLVGTQSHQATHTLVCVIVGSKEEPPGGMNWPPSDACVPTQCSGFLDDPSGGDEHPSSDTSDFGTTWVFSVF